MEKAGSMDDPSEGSDWRARSGGPPVMMASSSSTSETEWRRRAPPPRGSLRSRPPFRRPPSLLLPTLARALHPPATRETRLSARTTRIYHQGAAERGLTEKGCKQVEKSVERLKAMGVTSPQIFFDNGVRRRRRPTYCRRLNIPRKDVEPEFRWSRRVGRRSRWPDRDGEASSQHGLAGH